MCLRADRIHPLIGQRALVETELVPLAISLDLKLIVESDFEVFTDGDDSPEGNERLAVFEKTGDGFDLAEADFRLRGPGDLLGNRQSGLPPMMIANLTKDERILGIARTLAPELIDESPTMDQEDLKDLKSQVYRRYGKRLDLGDAA